MRQQSQLVRVDSYKLALPYLPQDVHLANTAVTVPEPPSPGPNDSPEVAIEKLKRKLEKTKADLEEANSTVTSQDKTIKSIEEEYEDRTKGFQEREETLQQDKKDLEEHMVSIVVQQVREAKAKERVTVAEECEAEVSTKTLKGEQCQD